MVELKWKTSVNNQQWNEKILIQRKHTAITLIQILLTDLRWERVKEALSRALLWQISINNLQQYIALLQSLVSLNWKVSVISGWSIMINSCKSLFTVPDIPVVWKKWSRKLEWTGKRKYTSVTRFVSNLTGKSPVKKMTVFSMKPALMCKWPTHS